MIDDNRTDAGLRYGILALLFVNVSLGGALTAFAAPPILMVAGIWSWNNSDVFLNLGIPALIAVIGNAMIFLLLYSKKLKSQLTELTKSKTKSSFNVVESLQVALFLTGLIEFGALQKWWLAPLLGSLSEHLLYSGSVVLTAAIDNAALTYLAAQVHDLSQVAKWAIVSGALTGGGLTILANAPNPAGFAILHSKFPDGLSMVKLLKAALIPTAVAFCCFYARLFIF